MRGHRRYLGLDASLWALNGRLALGAVRSLGRRTLTVSGLYLIALLIGAVLVSVLDHGSFSRTVGKMFFLFSPTVLTLLLLFAARSGLTGTAFFFTPAETSLLLTAPLPHAQLVRYKLYQMVLLLLLVSFVGSAFLVGSPQALPPVFEKVFLLLLFFQLMPILLTSFVDNEEAPALVALRLGLDLLFSVLLLSMGAAMYFRVLGKLSLSIFSASVFATLISPLTSFDLRLWHGNPSVSAGVIRWLMLTDALLVAAIWARSRNLKIESLLYKNLRRRGLRRGWWYGAAFRGEKERPAERGAPGFWGGLGPLLWRKGQECARNSKAMLLLTLLMMLGFTAIVLFFLKINAYDPTVPLFLPWHLLFCAECFTLLALLFSRFADFRADGDKMEVLLTLPVTTGKLLAGELLPALTYLLFLLALLLGLGAALFARTPTGRGIWVFAGWAVFTLPLRALLYLFVANLIALLFPIPRKTDVGLVTQFLAEFFGLGLLARLLYALELWAHSVTRDRPAEALGFFMLSGLPILVAVLALGWALRCSVRHFNPAKLAAG